MLLWTTNVGLYPKATKRRNCRENILQKLFPPRAHAYRNPKFEEHHQTGHQLPGLNKCEEEKMFTTYATLYCFSRLLCKQ
jgi:hypothetical protein